MSLSLPPPAPRPAPKLEPLPAGTTLWRVHSDAFGPVEFNPTRPKPFAGGRFDASDGSYAYLYSGSDTIAAVAETLLRDRPASGPYLIPRKRIERKCLAKLHTTRDLSLVVLHGAGLTAIRQTAELTACGPAEYATTRAWALALRADAPSATGFEWRPRHDNDRMAYVFFADRCASSDFALERSYELPSGLGLSLLKRALRAHGAAVA